MCGAALQSLNCQQKFVSSLGARAEGNPRYVEEVTKSLLESGLFHRVDGEYAPEGDVLATDIPDTISGSS